MKYPTVLAAPSSGSTLLKALNTEILENPNHAIYETIKNRIEAFKQNSTPLLQAILDIEKLYSLLPDNLRPNDCTLID